MAVVTENNYTGNGTTVLYPFTFPYLDQSDIKVTLNGTLTTAYTLSNPTTIQFNTAPSAGVAIRIYRKTDDSSLAATFYPGSAIRSQDLNDNFTQNLYVTQEANNSVATSTATSNQALSTANTALANSNSAVTTANTASSNASAALSTANTASANASAAVTTANAASTAATSAVNTANSAATNASTALSTANQTAADFAVLNANVYDKTELDGGQLDNRYYTETESDAKFWNKTTETIASSESWVSNDSTVPTTAAINNRLIDLINDVGAYIVVADEQSFPDSGIIDAGGSPDPGVLVAVTDATGLTWSSATSTNAKTSNNTTVTITGITGTSPITNCGVQVLSTSTLHVYTFVRWVVGSNVAQAISDNINEILQVDTNAANAAASATAASNSASAASTSASNAASSANAASISASNAAISATNASSSAANAANSATSAANTVTSILNLQYLQDWGLITNAAGTTTDYGVLV